MAVDVFDHAEQADYSAPWSTASPGVLGSSFLARGAGIWVITAALDAGASIDWPAVHGDEVIRVLSGQVVIEGEDLRTDDVVVIEEAVGTSLHAIEAARIIQFGGFPTVQPTRGVLGAAGAGAQVPQIAGGEDRHPLSSFGYDVDSSCPTCRLSLLRVDTDGSSTSGPHAHSADELIHVLEGELRVGGSVVPAGSTAFIPRGFRHSFRARGAFEFVHYRREMSYLAFSADELTDLESVARTQETWARRI